MDVKDWERRPDESPEAYSAFLAFRDDPDRSILHTYRRAKKKPNARQTGGCWNKWAKHFEWDVRRYAYERHLERVELKAREKAIQESQRKWQTRQEQIREDAYTIGESLKTKLKQMLALPVIETTKKEIVKVDELTGLAAVTNITVVKPAHWTYRDLARIYLAADDAMRRAAGLSDEPESVPNPEAAEPGSPQDDDMVARVLELIERASSRAGAEELDAGGEGGTPADPGQGQATLETQ